MTETNERPYIAFYRGKRFDLYATSSYAAQQKAAALLKAKKNYEVTVMLADVVHTFA